MGSGSSGEAAMIDDELLALERQRIAALLAADIASLQRLHAPDYQLITPNGRTFTRERYLSMIEAGSLRYLRWEPGAMALRRTPAMAIVRYRAMLELDGGAGRGTPFECWHTDSYELGADRCWQAVWSQATEIRPTRPEHTEERPA
jgi:hypothetical protein